MLVLSCFSRSGDMVECSAKSECQRAGKIRKFFLLALTLRLFAESYRFNNFGMKQLSSIILMETGVKTNEDMYPLSRDFSFPSIFLPFFLCSSVFMFSDWASSEVENPMKLLLVGLDVATNASF